MRPLLAIAWLVGASMTVPAALAQDPGACCIGEDQCVEVGRYACAGMNGSWRGAGTTCADDCVALPDGWLVEAPASWALDTCHGQVNDCDDTYESRDAHFVVVIPYDGDWFISTCGSRLYDTELFVGTSGRCSAELVDFDASGQDFCDLDAAVKLTLGQGDVVYVTVEGFSPDCGDFRLDVTTDCNGNDIPDACEIDGCCGIRNCERLEDCNGNLVPDGCDTDPTDPDGNGHVSADCDARGVPDECQTDCDGNGVPDRCDVDPTDPDGDGYVAPDCNHNLIPDACDVDPADPDGNGEISRDDDQDGVPDECEDCNRNGIPDERDIAEGRSLDCNQNCVPDECDAPCGADVVFLVDTSYSMREELPRVCDDLVAPILAALAEDVPGPLRTRVFAITEPDQCIPVALEDGLNVDVPGEPGSCNWHTRWGPATAIVSARFDWAGTAGVRAIVPVSDSGACGARPCDGRSDRDALVNAIDLAVAADVAVFPVTGELPGEDGPCIRAQADELAQRTGGVAHHRSGPDSLTYEAIGVALAQELLGRVPDECRPPDCGCPWDLDGDGQTGLDDLLRVLAGWGPCPGQHCPADLDCSGSVDFGDVLAVLDHWGPCD